MNPEEILKRLEALKAMIASFPEDTKILSVLVDYQDDGGSVQLHTPLERLKEAGLSGFETWETVDDPKRKYLKDSATVCGVRLIRLRKRENNTQAEGKAE